MVEHATITPRGPFSLAAAAEFGFGPSEGRAPAFDGVMRLAFPVDGGRGYAGAVLRQPGDALDSPVTVELRLTDGAPAETALRQVARIVSLDGDGNAFTAVGERDPAIGRLQRAHPGQRPVLFHSPYEGAAWAIISARRPNAVAARARTAIAQGVGTTFELAGETLHAFPQPDRLAALDPTDAPGLNLEKVERLRGVARAALEGALDVERLHALGPEETYAALQQLKGLGPFYAGLVMLRASGFADAALPMPEPRVLAAAGRLYELDEPPTVEWLAERAQAWRPFRTWTTVLIRLAGARGSFSGS